MIQARRATLPSQLRRDVEACGYFPEFVLDSVALALGDESVVQHLVHHETTFNLDSIHRHLSVLVLTATRLIVGHTDESPNPEDGALHAVSSTESVGLHQLKSVSVTRVVSHPEAYGKSASELVETWLSLGWGTLRRLEIEPAGCSDPNCDADHGYTGSMIGDDVTIRMSPAADGVDSVRSLTEFGTALQQLTSRA
ncbi:MAG TPA: DUF5998 family protein [Propionibacteriaceae bacterium]|nr:DUF5998 family protein [Propionibacteriaceae bacterium]